jgi:PAS domain S-box-containing protein
LGVVTVNRDITERKRTEQALRLSEERFAKAFRASPDGIVISRVSDGRLIEVNDRWTTLFGFSRQEAVGRTSVELNIYTRPLDRQHLISQVKAQGFIRNFEVEVRHKSGELFQVSMSVERVDIAGEQCMLSILRDITEQKRTEAALRESEQRYSAIFDKSPFAIALTKMPERVTVGVNDAFLKLFEYTREEVVGKTSVDLGIAEPEAQAQIAAELQATGHVSDFECTRTTKSGGRLALSLNLDWVSIGGARYVLTTIRDITKRKQAEEKLKQTVEELARSNTELQQFAYVASHDLQEPLRMIASYTQLLARRYKGKLDADADEFITFAVDGATRMQRLINDLLAYSRVGTQGKAPQPMSSEVVLEDALANLQIAITESQAIVTHDPLPIVPADETQLLQLFQNLIGNALKFRAEQPPQVHISAQARGHEWLFSVRDNGIGLEPQYAERIFVVFQRLHTRENYPGTGIGLAICKRIVERHGGHIWVESQPGQGTTFYFTLPSGDVSKSTQK